MDMPLVHIRPNMKNDTLVHAQTACTRSLTYQLLGVSNLVKVSTGVSSNSLLMT